jgi:copper chaperone
MQTPIINNGGTHMTTKYQLETLTCPSCAMKIKAALGKVAGVESVEVLFNASKVVVTYKQEAHAVLALAEKSVEETLARIGFPYISKK